MTHTQFSDIANTLMTRMYAGPKFQLSITKDLSDKFN